MAQGKKAFVMYCDWENVFEMLTNDEAGKLVKHLFAYVNDKKPALDDRILQVAFEPIKQQIKRDQQKYEDTRKKRVEAGRAGGIKSGESRSGSKQGEANEANASNVKQVKANEAVTVTDTVTGIDIYSFDQFWDDYDKKVGKTEASKKWRRLTREDILKIKTHVPVYIAATPDKQYRKNPATYLNQKSWEDEIITKNGSEVQLGKTFREIT